MNNIPKQLILIGGGSSIKEGIEKGLWEKLKGQWTIGLNYSYKFFDSTMLCYADKDFYTIGSAAFSPDQRKRHEEILKNLPLIVGKLHRGIKTSPNTITLQTNDGKYFRDVRLGCYKSTLVGLFALSLAIYLLDEGEIFLLGFDYSSYGKAKDGKPLTHFYQGDINHRGIGKTNYYEHSGDPDRDFGVYANEKKVKIYNISVMSKINTFTKCGWDWFFENLDKQEYDQEELRKEIRRKLQ